MRLRIVPHLPRGNAFRLGSIATPTARGSNMPFSAIEGTHHGAWATLTSPANRSHFVHGDDRRLMHDLETAKTFDFIFYGHTHIADERRVGRTRVINPGAHQRAAVKSFVILNVADRRVGIVRGGVVWLRSIPSCSAPSGTWTERLSIGVRGWCAYFFWLAESLRCGRLPAPGIGTIARARRRGRRASRLGSATW